MRGEGRNWVQQATGQHALDQFPHLTQPILLICNNLLKENGPNSLYFSIFSTFSLTVGEGWVFLLDISVSKRRL